MGWIRVKLAMCPWARSWLEIRRELSRATSKLRAMGFIVRKQNGNGEKSMSIRSTIILNLQQIAEEGKKALPPLTDDLVLLDLGLDSLAVAILVARLDETLGLDPFTESDDIYYPVTLGDLIRFYEKAVK